MELLWKKLVLIVAAPACAILPAVTVFQNGVPGVVEQVTRNFRKLDEEWEKTNKEAAK